MSDRFDEFKLDEDEGKAAHSGAPDSPFLFDWETRDGLPTVEYDHLGWLRPVEHAVPSSDDGVAPEYNAEMSMGCEFCLASYAVSHHPDHMQLYHPEKVQPMSVAPIDTQETDTNYHTLRNMAAAPVYAHETDENYHALAAHSARRRHSAAEAIRERLGPRPSLEAIQLIAKSPLSVERQLGQQLLEERGRKDNNKRGRGPALKAPAESTRLKPSRLNDDSFLHVDLKAPLKERNGEDCKKPSRVNDVSFVHVDLKSALKGRNEEYKATTGLVSPPQQQQEQYPLRRVTITRSGEGGATKIVIRRQSKSHVVVSLPYNPLKVYDD